MKRFIEYPQLKIILKPNQGRSEGGAAEPRLLMKPATTGKPRKKEN